MLGAHRIVAGIRTCFRNPLEAKVARSSLEKTIGTTSKNCSISTSYVSCDETIVHVDLIIKPGKIQKLLLNELRLDERNPPFDFHLKMRLKKYLSSLKQKG